MIATILTALQLPEDLPKEQTPKNPVEIQAGFSHVPTSAGIPALLKAKKAHLDTPVSTFKSLSRLSAMRFPDLT